MKSYKVYKHTSPNNKVYIGITMNELEKRWSNGSGYRHNDYFYRAIKKYGWDNFKHEVLFEDLSREEAEIAEMLLIKTNKSTNPMFGYNINNGGNTIGTHSELSKQKMSIAHKGSRHINFGKHLSLETRMKISESNKGKKLSKETIQKLIASRKGVPSKLRIKIICIETKEIFDSLTEAAEHKNVSSGHISKCCKDSKLTIGGYHWMYYSDYLEHGFNLIDREIYNSKKVICIETNTVFKTLSIAENKTGVAHGSISRCCNKKLKTAGGFHWMYYDDYIETGFIEPKYKRHYRAKRVLCIETNEVFDTVKEAGEYKKVNKMNIAACCRGERNICANSHWKYI